MMEVPNAESSGVVTPSVDSVPSDSVCAVAGALDTFSDGAVDA